MPGKDSWLDAQLRKAMKHADAIADATDHTQVEKLAALERIGRYFQARAQAIPPDPEEEWEDDDNE